MSCILSANGRDFDVDRFLKRTVLQPKRAWRLVNRRDAFYLAMNRSKQKTLQVWHRGEPIWTHKSRSKRRKHSGFLLDVSKASFDNLPQQIRDVIRFLKTNARVLKSLHRFP